MTMLSLCYTPVKNLQSVQSVHEDEQTQPRGHFGGIPVDDRGREETRAYERGNSRIGTIARFGYINEPTQCRFVASRRVVETWGRPMETSRGRGGVDAHTIRVLCL